VGGEGERKGREGIGEGKGEESWPPVGSLDPPVSYTLNF